ncbi:MAG: hypothetical protein WC679_01670 [Bacteroidales bacterium]|jgi:hypothetical protein
MQVDVERMYILTMNELEMNWLKGIMQNPLYNETPETEEAQTRRMRSTFWQALNNIEEDII